MVSGGFMFSMVLAKVHMKMQSSNLKTGFLLLQQEKFEVYLEVGMHLRLIGRILICVLVIIVSLCCVQLCCLLTALYLSEYTSLPVYAI
jgi:ABC-type phosphate transport system permease subunit